MGSPASRCAVSLCCSRLAGVGPPWGPHIYASSVRGRASLTRGYRVVRPRWGRRPRGVGMGGGGPSAARDFACVETRFIASHPLGAQPRLGILPSLWAIRAVSDAMNRVATWRTSRADRVCFRDVGYCLRRDAIHRVSPARGAAPPRHSSLASGRLGGGRRDESRLYVADFPCGLVCAFAGRVALCAIWHSVNADTHRRLRFSVGKAARWGEGVDSSHGLLFPSHGSADPSHGNLSPWALFHRKWAPICAI